jgi:hypothetical protein
MLLDLLFPPFDTSVLMPELGIPQLTANLRRAGHQVRQADLNIEFIVDHLGDLASYAPLFRGDERSAGVPQDRDGFLRYLSDSLCRLTGRDLGQPADPFESIRRFERRAQKSCQLAPHQIRTDWRQQAAQLAAGQSAAPIPAGLATLARLGARDAAFRARLYRLLQHHYFAPRSFQVPDVLDSLAAPHPLLDRFYEASLAQKTAARPPDCFALAIWSTFQLVPALRLAKLLKGLFPRVPVVAGGAWCSYAGDLIPRVPELFDHIDGFVLDEADQAMLALASSLERGGALAGPSNLLTRRSIGQARPQSPAPPAVEELALPVYDGLPLDYYPLAKLVLRLARGCYWSRCVMCSHVRHPYNSQFASPKSARLSGRFLERLAAHIRSARQEHSIVQFTTADNLIAPGIMRQLADLQPHCAPGFQWDSLARFQREYTASFCRDLRRGGCVRLDLGLEVADDDELRRIRKGLKLETVLANLKHLKAAEVTAMVFVSNHPGQSPEAYRASLEWIVEHRDLIPLVSLSRFHLAHSSLAHCSPEALGITPLATQAIDLNVFDLGYRAEQDLREQEFLEITRQYADQLPSGGFTFEDLVPGQARRSPA